MNNNEISLLEQMREFARWENRQDELREIRIEKLERRMEKLSDEIERNSENIKYNEEES